MRVIERFSKYTKIYHLDYGNYNGYKENVTDK